ncbi:transposon Tn7 transposition protein TnsA [Clostridium homopropionicum DSM 5847]|uniref:Transposon Tn7 transposition protein TnsA n=1 Tax=Clostridium homopropionicum DSM 5847 TaxID=1121318 RepID=A0A0L6Z915_9CLOT|nr:heteromeric transposase endonuclease subunit TnsA [Clostridium homopropionicum]KOA19460.1 transposon Tn7 transposition protein TnsA [Clostridium homopropionicum DSM 5847]SFG82235.1 TnsA endonuclease N terminal [Clostridium homopropionicum]
MAKRSNDWDSNKLNRWIKEGRGQGEGKEYKPWLTVQDFPSMGRVTRVFGWTTQRIHHFFSDTQLKYFYLLDWEERVIDIREHYPLIDLEVVLKDTSDLRLGKFIDRKTKEPYILTTTFLITLLNSDGKKSFAARSIKYASELSKKSTIEKLEIERRYWKVQGIDWGIVTNKDINDVRAKNIEWVHSAMNSDDCNGLSKAEFDDLFDGILYRFIDNKQSIKNIIAGFEKDYSLDVGMGLLLFKRLVAEKRIVLDMDKPINLSQTGKSVYIPEISDKGGNNDVKVYG